MASKMYGNLPVHLFNGRVNWPTGNIKVALLGSTYTPDQDAHDYWDDVSANQVTGTGYTAGGQALATKTLTYDAATNRVRLDADDVSWANSTITARYAVIYQDTGTATTSPLIGYVDFVSDQTSADGTFTIQWDAAGIFEVTVA